MNNCKYLWISNILPMSIVDAMHLSVAGKKMENAIVECMTNQCDCDILSVSDQGLEESKRYGFRLGKDIPYRQIVKPQKHLFANLEKEKRIYQYLLKWCKSNSDNNKTVIITNYPLCVCRPLIKLKRKYRLTLVSFVQDYYQISYSKGVKNWFLHQINHRYYQKGFHLLNRFDGIIGLNDSIRKWFDPNIAFYRTMIGISDSQCFGEPPTMSGPIKIGFFGSLVRQNGIEDLINAFDILPCGEYEIHIYGSGPLAEFVEKYCATNQYAIYHGQIASEDIGKCMSSIDLFVNLQAKDNSIVSDFNFPSKLIDYYCSGRPVICTDFDGLPEQYKDFTFIVDDTSPEVVKKKIMELSAAPFNLIYNKCKTAQKYIYDEQRYPTIVNKMLAFTSALSNADHPSA